MEEAIRVRFGDLVQRGVFRPVARFIAGNEAEDRLQDAVAQCWEACLRYARRGVHLDTAILVRMCRFRAVDLGRRFVRGGQPRRDVLHVQNYLTGRVQVLHLDRLEDVGDGWRGEGDAALETAWAAATSVDPAENLAAAVDLDAWLADLAPADQRLLAARMAGFSLEEISQQVERSLTWTFQRLRALGTHLADHAGIVLVRKKRKPRGRALRARC